jgi:hypothetical protein
VFAREVSAQILAKVGLQHLKPSSDVKSFQDWWRSSERRVDAAVKKGFNSLVALGAWWIWRHRNNVFNGVSPSVTRVLHRFRG